MADQTDAETEPETETETDESTDAGDSEESQSAGKLPDAEDMSDDEREKIESDRQERLDPDNRPEGSEIDNSDRDFDVESGQFEDADKDLGLGPFNDPEAEDGEAEA